MSASQYSLAGRVALVTGGSRGIGRAISLSLAQAGADVAVNYRRDEAAAAEVVQQISALGRKARAYAASVENWDEDVATVEAVARDLGPVGILVSNAGVASRGNSVADTDPGELERVMRVHAFAPHYLCKLVIPSMRKLGRGDIIIISSINTVQLKANGAPYSMGKAAAEALALTLAKEERQYGIRANVVQPSVTVTEMGRKLVRATHGSQTDIHELDAQAPFGHVSVPEDVAGVVAFLVSPANSYGNGQRFAVDGGG